jgi:hypothetical protein
MKSSPFALALLLALAAHATAREPASQVKPMTVNADSREAFAAVADEVRQEMGPNGRFQYVSAAERKDIEDGLRRMALIYERAPTVAELNKRDQVALFNEQEVVNSILKNRDSDRVICKRERKTGSNLTTTSCITYGEREAHRRSSQAYMNEVQNGAAIRLQ